MAQSAVETYDRVEIPKIEPDVTRVVLRGGVCPCCARTFKAPPPAGLAAGLAFGPELRAYVIYLRSVQGIPLARLSDLFKDLFGLEISEGALVKILRGARGLRRPDRLPEGDLKDGGVIASDETGLRVGKKNTWLWVFHHGPRVCRPWPIRAAPGRWWKTFWAIGRPRSGYRTATAVRSAGRSKGHQFCAGPPDPRHPY